MIGAIDPSRLNLEMKEETQMELKLFSQETEFYQFIGDLIEFQLAKTLRVSKATHSQGRHYWPTLFKSYSNLLV